MVIKASIWYPCFVFTIVGLIFSNPSFAQDAKRFIGEPENLGTAINTSDDELNPVFSPDGSTLYFTRKGYAENVGGKRDPGDIWFSKRDDSGHWTTAVNAGRKLNNNYYNAVIGFSPDGNTIYLAYHYFNHGLRPKTQGFSFSTRKGGEWSAPQKVTIDNFYNESDRQSMALSSDGKILVIAIDGYGSYGYEDLYVSFRNDDGSWTAPKNMGSTLNTSLQEMTPFLAKDNATLYFASSGHNSTGSRDIFVSKRLDNSWRVWSEPQNITAINSEGIELSYILSPDGKYAYYVSTQNSDGFGDINRIRINQDFQPVDTNAVVMDIVEPDTVIVIPENEALADIKPVLETESDTVNDAHTFKVKGVVLNKKNEEPVDGAKVSFLPLDAQASEPVTLKAASGKFTANLRKDVKYKVKISSEGYMVEEETLASSAVGAGAMGLQYYLTPLDAGTTFQLKNVLFERGTAKLVDSSYLALDKVVEMMRENPEVKIEIAGHTDNQGDAGLNLKLSQRRAQTVVDYLVEKGLSRNRLVSKGYGGTRPIASNRLESTRRLNRRVEFTVLQNDKGDQER